MNIKFKTILIASFCLLTSNVFGAPKLHDHSPTRPAVTKALRQEGLKVATTPPPARPPIAPMPITEDAAYICAVGSGSCNIVINTIKDPTTSIETRVALIFDAGTKSAKTHQKLVNRANEFYILFDTHAAMPATAAPPHSDAPPFDLVVPDHAPASRTISELSIQSSKDQKGVTISNVQNKRYLQTILAEHQCDLIILMLSHPDADHISYTDLIPHTINGHNVPMLAILGGDWLSKPLVIGHKYTKTGYKLELTETGDVIKYLTTRPETEVFLPFYEQYKQTDLLREVGKELAGISPKNTMLTSFGHEASDFRKMPTDFMGNLSELIKKYHLDNAKKFAVAAPMLEDIYIWSLNSISSDQNEQSIIASYTHPQLNQTFIFTGDATDYQFRQIAQRLTTSKLETDDETLPAAEEAEAHIAFKKNPKDVIRSGFFSKRLRKKLDAKHIVVFVVPHHGSSGNISGAALQLFCPNIFAISAGNGGLYPHPELEVIEHINNWGEKNPSYAAALQTRFPTHKPNIFAAFEMQTFSVQDTAAPIIPLDATAVAEDSTVQQTEKKTQQRLKPYAISTDPKKLHQILLRHKTYIIGEQLKNAAAEAKKAGEALKAAADRRKQIDAALTSKNKIRTILTNLPANISSKSVEELRDMALTARTEELAQYKLTATALANLTTLITQYKAIPTIPLTTEFDHSQTKHWAGLRYGIARSRFALTEEFANANTSPFILCTNGLGTLRFRANDIANQFSDIVTDNAGNKYQISFQTHVASMMSAHLTNPLNSAIFSFNKKNKLASLITGMFTKQSISDGFLLFINPLGHGIFGIRVPGDNETKRPEKIYWYYTKRIAAPTESK